MQHLSWIVDRAIGGLEVHLWSQVRHCAWGLPPLPIIGGQLAVAAFVGAPPRRCAPAVPLPLTGHSEETLFLQLGKGALRSTLADTEQASCFVQGLAIARRCYRR